MGEVVGVGTECIARVRARGRMEAGTASVDTECHAIRGRVKSWRLDGGGGELERGMKQVLGGRDAPHSGWSRPTP